MVNNILASLPWNYYKNLSLTSCQELQVAAELRERGIAADYYHADMDVNAREKVHMR